MKQSICPICKKVIRPMEESTCCPAELKEERCHFYCYYKKEKPIKE
jgi:hypothetical protein